MSSELRVNNFKARSGLGTVAVNDTGLEVAGIVTAASFIGDVTGNITGDVTGNVTGDVSGNATGLTGTPDITVNNVVAGVITATTYVGVPEGTNVLKAMLFV